MATARPSPSSPNANKQSGKPRLPVFPSVSAGRNERCGKPRILISTADTAATPSVTTIIAPTICQNCASGSVSCDKLVNTRLGPATYMMMRVTNAMSNGTPVRRHP